MTVEQPLDKRIFDSRYDDIEILGKLVTRGDGWQPIGVALHVQNGAIFGAAYTRLKPSPARPAGVTGPAVRPRSACRVLAGGRAGQPLPPARKQLPKLVANPRAFGQATIRHAVFGVVLGLLEAALNDRQAPRRPEGEDVATG